MKNYLMLAAVFSLGFGTIPHAPAQCNCSYALLDSTNAGYSQVAVDDTFVYFGDNAGNIRKVAKAGGAATVVATYPGNRVITGIAVDATNIYFGIVGTLPYGYSANIGEIASVPKGGGTITTLTTAATNLIFLEVDDTHVYWDSYGYFAGIGSFPQQNGFIARVPKGGGAVQMIATGLASSDNFALDGNDLYYGETGYVSPNFTAGTLKRVAKTGGAATALYAGVTGYVSTDANYVYCSSHFAGELFRVPKAGGARQVYLTGLVFPGQVKARDNQLYFAVDDNAGDNGFYGVLDVNTGNSQILRSGIPSALALDLDACALYGMGKDGTVHRICRPSGTITAATTFSLATNQMTVTEFDYQATLQVIRSGDTSFTASVSYNTADGTALAGGDYTTWGVGTFEFLPGETIKTVGIPIVQDTNAEPDESFSFYLLAPTAGAALGNITNVNVTIHDNDRPGPGKPNGAITAEIGNQYFGTVNAVARQSDGCILAGGQFQTVNGTNRNNFVRVLPSGTLDLSYGTATGVNGQVYAVTLQSDGKSVIAGAFTSVEGTSRPGCARLNSTGTLDETFMPPSLSFFTILNALALQPDGRVLVGGNYNYNATNLVRLNTNGTLDAAFAAGNGADGPIYCLALQADGKVLVGGNFTSFNGVPATNLVRLASTGAIDPTFTASLMGIQYQSGVNAIVPLADGRIVVGGGFTNVNNTACTNLARLSTNGVLDTAFAASLNRDGRVRSIVVQGDGKLLIGGDFNVPGAVHVARLNGDGSYDTRFDVGAGPNGSVGQLLRLASGDLLVAGGFTKFNEQPAIRLVILQGSAATTSPAPALRSFGLVAGQFNLVFSAASGATWVVEGSTDLISWTGLQTNTASGGDQTFSDANTPAPRRFYRIKIP